MRPEWRQLRCVSRTLCGTVTLCARPLSPKLTRYVSPPPVFHASQHRAPVAARDDNYGHDGVMTPNKACKLGIFVLARKLIVKLRSLLLSYC